MSQLPMNEAVQRFKENEERMDVFVNESDTTDVLPRTGGKYPTLRKAVKQLFVNGGLPAIPFETKAKMETEGASLADGVYVAVTNDDDKTKNGLYIKKAGVWTETGYGKAGVDKQYVDTQGANLFAKSEFVKFPNADLVVRRYLTTGESRDYTAGTYQTASADGLKVAVPASGSSGITHYFRTNLLGFSSVTSEFVYTGINDAVSGEGAGVGYLNDSGQYILFVYSSSGVLRKYINQNLVVQISTEHALLTVGDTAKITIIDNTVSFYKNSVLQKTIPLLDEDKIKGREIIFGQVGFSRYTTTMTAVSDPIRDYVNNKISQVVPDVPAENNPTAFYQFNKTGGGSSVGLMTVYSLISGDSYVGFEIAHEVDMRDIVYQDYWRIHKADFYTLTDGAMVATGKKALDTGESEFVWKQTSNKVDFTGGYHGDELVTDLTFLANGLPISLSVNIALTACNTFEYIEKSTMHETANKDSDPFITGHPVIANHIKNTSFYDGGYKTYNKITFNYAGTMSTLYHGISCISKDVAQTVIAGNDFTRQAMTGSGSNYFEEAKARDYNGYNTANKLSSKATARIVRNDVADLASTFFVHDRSTDSKYYRKSPPKNVVVGEVMESEFSCFFNKS